MHFVLVHTKDLIQKPLLTLSCVLATVEEGFENTINTLDILNILPYISEKAMKTVNPINIMSKILLANLAKA